MVIDQIDPADKQRRAIDQRKLAVQAPQRSSPQTPTRQRTKNSQLDRACGKQRSDRSLRDAGAEAIDHHPHTNAALRRTCERSRNPSSARVIMEQVGFDRNRFDRLIDRALERGKKFSARLQQAHLMPGAQYRPPPPAR
jgi:hypothetical protein